jgi:hypothetical protein
VAKVLIETAEEATPCANYLCDVVVPPGGLLYPARLRSGVYCSTLCRNRHSRRLVQDRRRADPAKNRKDNDKRIERKYGISIEEYRQKMEAQKRACAICKAPFSGTRPHTDHDHETGTFRGILCGSCNVGLGYFYDSPELLRGAISYLLEDSVSAPDVVVREGGVGE